MDPTDTWMIRYTLMPKGMHLLSVIYSPLITSVWVINLTYHPDAQFASYIANGSTDGFHIGYSRALSSVLASTKRNMRSAYENCSVVEARSLPREDWLVQFHVMEFTLPFSQFILVLLR